MVNGKSDIPPRRLYGIGSIFLVHHTYGNKNIVLDKSSCNTINVNSEI